jgi:HEAT repeat protein
VKGSAAGALGMIKDPRAIEPLIKTLGINEKYSNLSYKASAALHEITGENFGQEVDKWEKWQMGK